MRIVVAVSGGVDSLCALWRLRQQGHDVLALHGLFLPCDDSPLSAAAGTSPAGGRPVPAPTASPHTPLPPAALFGLAPDASTQAAPLLESSLADQLSPALSGLRQTCRRLNIPLYLLDARALFDESVIRPFVRAYAAGQTPNPCALCNRHIKFGILAAAARLLDGRLATGHYARLAPLPEGNGMTIASATDTAKDQGYFLALVPPPALQEVLFPLADLRKQDCLAAVREAGLAVPLPGESQEICFIPTREDAYRDFLQRRWVQEHIVPPAEGPMLLCCRQPDGSLTERPVGRHAGLWRHTEGQRRGLGIAYSEPLYVLAKDTARNALLVGPRALLGMLACRTEPANFFLPPRHWPLVADTNETLRVRLRYRQQPVPAQVDMLPDGGLHIRLNAATGPHFPSAPGQVAAVYDAAGRILAGARISGVSQLMESAADIRPASGGC